jgi:hypothetical protein
MMDVGQRRAKDKQHHPGIFPKNQKYSAILYRIDLDCSQNAENPSLNAV